MTPEEKKELGKHIDISSVGSNTLAGTTIYNLTEAPSRARRKTNHGDTILATVRPNLRAFLFIKNPKPNLVVSTGFAVLRPTKHINKQFLFYTVTNQEFTNYLTINAKGAAYPAVDADIIKRAKINLPSLSTQNKIASILSAYDDLIENNTRRIKILESMAQTLYQKWFVKFRFPGHEQVKMVESELGLIPEGWEAKELSDVCVRITDGSHWSPKSVDDGYPMASVKDMHAWGLKIESCRKISTEDYEKLVRNDCKPLKNDILVAKDGSYLKHIFVTEKESDLVILSSIALLRPNEKILPHILSFYLLQPSIKSRMANYVSGAALPRIILKSFRKFKILVPPISLQKEFYQIAEPMITNCYCLIDKNDNLRKTRDLLLPKLISGQIDVENLDIDTGELAA